jgi:hypothetical protein
MHSTKYNAETSISTLLLSLLLFARYTAALNPSCAPGGNFDLSPWSLQMPIGSSSNPGTAETLPISQLTGCSGFENFSYFFTESGDGALVMKVPGTPSATGCVTTANSAHCRTEL